VLCCAVATDAQLVWRVWWRQGKRASAKPPREKSPGTPPIGAGGAGGSLSISEPALLLRLTTELVAMRDNMADMVDMFTVRLT